MPVGRSCRSTPVDRSLDTGSGFKGQARGRVRVKVAGRWGVRHKGLSTLHAILHCHKSCSSTLCDLPFSPMPPSLPILQTPAPIPRPEGGTLPVECTDDLEDCGDTHLTAKVLRFFFAIEPVHANCAGLCCPTCCSIVLHFPFTGFSRMCTG